VDVDHLVPVRALLKAAVGGSGLLGGFGRDGEFVAALGAEILKFVLVVLVGACKFFKLVKKTHYVLYYGIIFKKQWLASGQ
jgi:hypothetical protein